MSPRVSCKKCNRTFENANNLFQHKLTHRQANIECYGCDRMFTTYGGMFIHLEAGACDSGITLTDLNRSAALCYQWKKYLDAEFRDELLDEDDGYLYDRRRDDKAFKCPTCGNWMNRLSGLFQHVESPSCEADVEEGVVERLKWWLYKRCAGWC